MTDTATNDTNIITQPFGEILSERYLSYALSTIMSRSLPDVRDGLKPVHRRLMYAMHQLKLNPNTSPKKCARVVGDVIGKFHPHGDQAVYDALVRLAQDFAVRYPLIDGQGNFGNIDGDNAAAMRYTESRLTAVAELLLEGIEENAVDFKNTYDDEGEEPLVLPANFPNLLANGSSGIAVGMATNIPPHNVAELCGALIAMLEGNPDTAALIEHVQGPDFPTGGILVEPKDSIINTYETGKGAFRLRAKWDVEELKQGQYQIVVTEIPYQVQKSKLIEKMAELINAKKLPLMDDVNDESTEDIRIVITPKSRNVDADILMEALFKHTDLETRFNLNMNVLDGGRVPRVMSLKEALRAWLDHRQEVLIRRSNHRLNKVTHRLEVLDGYLIVYLNIDEVIRIIREDDDPKASLMKTFKLTEVQAEAILNMRLRSLRKLEEMELRKEYESLSNERDELQALIKSESRQWTRIKKDIKALQKAYAPDTELGQRRTTLGEAPSAEIIDLESVMIEKEPITILCSDMGWIKALKGHNQKTNEISYKDGDSEAFILEAQTTDKLLIFCSNGRFYTIPCDKLPSGRGYGEPVRLMADMPNDAQIVSLSLYDPGRAYVIASNTGRGFRVKADDVLAQTKNGKQILNVGAGERAVACAEVAGDHIAVIGKNRKLLAFPLEEVPEMAKGKGVILQKYKDGGLSDITTFTLEEGLTFRYGGGETTVDITEWLGKRAQSGRLPPNGFPRDNLF